MDEGLARVFKTQGVKASLGTKLIGKKIYSYGLVTSTNDIVHFLANQDEPEGSVVFAKGQTQGRGRQGNAWISPYGSGLYFSFLLRPLFTAQEASRITLAMALGVVKALEEVQVDELAIKWPNDILVGEKKVCGILTEMCLEDQRIKYVVVGVGINVNASPTEQVFEATSLKEACGRTFDIADLSHIIIRQIDQAYQDLLKHRFSDIVKEIKHYSGLILGGRVRVSWQERVVEGYAVDFDEHGALVIRKDNGMLEKISSGHLIKL